MYNNKQEIIGTQWLPEKPDDFDETYLEGKESEMKNGKENGIYLQL